ncbi:MAG TPA: PLP-dependent aminotransferase family protein [Candidatus Acetothermia bacterium]|nr:PLP-dependent aminotransferase family protein [Candidatus Acetothermia bacterium]
MNSLFAERTKAARRSVIRELLKLTEQPHIISFAGGLPDPATFPREFLAKVAADEILSNPGKTLQYTTTEGKLPLRELLSRWFAEDGMNFPPDQIVVTSASQQGLDLIAKAFLDPGDAVLVGLPTYIGAIQAFQAMQAKLVGVPLEDDGMDLDALSAAIATARRGGHTPKFIYVVPDFQNPSGITWSEDKRRGLLQIAGREDLVVVEDMPYRKLRFVGRSVPAVASLDTEGRVVVLFTLSKTLAAGLRLGALAGPNEIVEKIVTLKQATDLCTSSLTQRLAIRFFQEYDVPGHIRMICNHYRGKRDAMLDALDRHMPAEEGISWTKPEGGLFLWVRFPEIVDTERMLLRAIEHKVAYVIGAPFFVNGRGHNTMRLSFSSATADQIEEGIHRLGQVVEEELASLGSPQRA